MLKYMCTDSSAEIIKMEYGNKRGWKTVALVLGKKLNYTNAAAAAANRNLFSAFSTFSIFRLHHKKM